MREESCRPAERLGERRISSSSPRTPTRSAPPLSASLALLALAVLALLPPGGMTLCLGHDGHVALSVGGEAAAVTAQGDEPAHCPCDQESSTANPPAALSIGSDAHGPIHAPCDDLPVEGPAAKALPRAFDAVGDDAALASLELAGTSSAVAHALDPAPSLVRRAAPVAATLSRHSLAVLPSLSSRRLV